MKHLLKIIICAGILPAFPDSSLTQETWTTYGNSNFIEDIALQKDWVWCATPTGVERWDISDMSYQKFTTIDGLAHNFVLSAAEGLDGDMWFGTWGGGVSRYYGEKWTTFTTDDGLGNNTVWSIALGHDGAVWFGTYEGVSRYHDDKWTTFTTADGLMDDDI